MAITKVINDAVDLNQASDYSGLRLPVGTTGDVIESFTTDYLVVGGGGGSGTISGAGGAGGLRTSYNNSTTTTNTLSFPSGKTAIATYMLDNNATDISGNYNGTETNITYNTGQYGGAAVFNGSSSKISVTNSIKSIFTNNFSASVWAKPSSVASAGQSILDFFEGAGVSCKLQIDSTKVRFISYNGSGYDILNTTNILSNNIWYCFTLTRSGNNYELFTNGVSVGTLTSNTVEETSNPFGIGFSTSNSQYFNGSIDQVRIYDSALSSTDVTNIYNNEVQANSGGGVAAESSLTLTADVAYDVTVGAGGTGVNLTSGNNGANSIFSTITSLGGGFGGLYDGSAYVVPGNGGSGGGGSLTSSLTRGNGTLNQGYEGGYGDNSGPPYSTGGGGGAASPGQNSPGGNTGGTGGAGLEVNIIGGSGNYYAGGGGGAGETTGASGGIGGGGDGSGSSNGGENGAFNTGGGAGGWRAYSRGFDGGSGVVILRYPTANVSSFTTTGTLNTPSTTDTIADTAYPVANTAYYKLDNSAIDLSGSTGKFDQGGVFNGSSSKIVANSPIITTGAFSVSFWVNVNNFSTSYSAGLVTNSSNSGSVGFSTHINYITKKVSFFFGGGSVIVNSNSALTENTWFHIVCTYDGTNLKMYVDDALQTSTATGTMTSASNNLHIGTESAFTSRVLDGTIDQVRLYNVALSSTDVTALYNETVSTTGQLNFPSGQTAIATYELNGNANGILTTTDLSTVNYPAGAGCIALYEMNGTADDTSGVYNGTPSNIDYNFGAFGQAAVFNGSSSYIDVSSLTYLFDSKATATVSLWFNTSTTATTSVLFSDYASSTARNFLVSINSTGNIVWNTRYGSGAGRDSNITTTSTYNDGSWHHIVLSIDQAANAKSMYVDGSQIGSSIALPTATGASFDSTQRVTMGSSYNTGTAAYQDYYNGSIDQVRIFNTALTQSQVTTLARGIGTSYSGVDTNVSYAYNGVSTDVTYANGRFNKAALFNGSSSKITLPNSTGGIGETDSSFSFWVYPVSVSSGYEIVALLTNNDWIEIRYNSSGQFVIYPARQSNGTYISFSAVSKTANNWYNIVITRDSATSTIKLYIDGSLVETNTSWDGTLTSAASDPNGLGANVYSNTLHFSGKLDQVKIFETALSSTQVTQLYNEHYQTQFTDGSDTAIVFTQGTGTVTFSGVDPAPPQGALRANTSYSEDGSGSVIEHYNGTDWKYFDAIKYCTTNTLNFPSGAGCIASYNLDNNVNDIGNTYNGVNSNVTFNASGKFGAAAVFNGSSSAIVLPNNILSSDFSISAWFYLNNTSGNQYLFEFDYENRVLFRVSSTDNNWAYIGNSGYFNPGITYNAGQWYNVVITFSNGNPFKIYVNGVLSYTSGNTSVSPFSNDNILGAANSSGSGAVNGLIDQVRIFNDSLTSDEVAQLYNNEIACS